MPSEPITRFGAGLRRLLKSRLGDRRFFTVCHFLDAFTRILPHTQTTSWKRNPEKATRGAHWASPNRRALSLHVAIPLSSGRQSLHITADLKRLVVFPGQRTGLTLDLREQALCNQVISVIFDFMAALAGVESGRKHRRPTADLVQSLSASFDQTVIARYIWKNHSFSPMELFASLRELSERSYEGKSIPLGIIVETGRSSEPIPIGLGDLLRDKKYHVLTDGYDTAYEAQGEKITRIRDLEQYSQAEAGTARRFYPEWSRFMALSCTGKRIGFSLTRQGDILYFDSGTLRITYRAGRWQYWNHTYVLEILLQASRARHVSPAKRRKILFQIYRRALDLSFRRTGGLFVLLQNRQNLREIVRKGDAIGDNLRRNLDQILDGCFGNQSILGFPARVLVDIASMDGAVVFDNSGRLLAYGAVLKQKGSRSIRRGQGSRTKAAIGASHYGLAAKISSDGDISFYEDGREILAI